jgi:hypothetical protein
LTPVIVSSELVRTSLRAEELDLRAEVQQLTADRLIVDAMEPVEDNLYEGFTLRPAGKLAALRLLPRGSLIRRGRSYPQL